MYNGAAFLVMYSDGDAARSETPRVYSPMKIELHVCPVMVTCRRGGRRLGKRRRGRQRLDEETDHFGGDTAHVRVRQVEGDNVVGVILRVLIDTVDDR